MKGDSRNAIRIALADDHPIVLNGLERLLDGEADLEIVARCADGGEACRAVTELRPDVLILDLRMPVLDGFSVIRHIRAQHSQTRVVLLTATLDDGQIAHAIQLGIDAILFKETAPRRLVECIRKVHAGERWIDHDLMTRAIGSLAVRRQTRDPREALTPRELEVMRMVSSGLRNKDIAGRLQISEGTVKIHLHAIYEKLNLDGRLKLTVLARETGLV